MGRDLPQIALSSGWNILLFVICCLSRANDSWFQQHMFMCLHRSEVFDLANTINKLPNWIFTKLKQGSLYRCKLSFIHKFFSLQSFIFAVLCYFYFLFRFLCLWPVETFLTLFVITLQRYQHYNFSTLTTNDQ